MSAPSSSVPVGTTHNTYNARPPLAIDLTAKAQIAEPCWQLILREARTNNIIPYCPCGLPLEIFHDKHNRGENVRARFAQLELHKKTCPVVHGPCPFERLHEGNVIFTDALFFPNGARYCAAPQHSASRAGSAYYGDLTCMVNQGFMVSTLCAIVEANKQANKGDAFKMPSCRSQSRHFSKYMLQNLMSDGTSPVNAAARNGLTLYWGVTDQPIVNRFHANRHLLKDDTLVLERCWGANGRQNPSPVFTVPSAVALAAGGKVYEFDRLIQGPYFIACAVDNQTMHVQQITVIPLAYLPQEDAPWISKESGREGDLISRVDRLNLPVGMVKPGVSCDLGLLGKLWPYKVDSDGFLPCRPDLLVIGRNGAAIYQLMGSSNWDYRTNVFNTVKIMRRFFNDRNVIVRAIDLKELESGLPTFENEITSIA